jgi:hypothetical protein
MQQVLGPAWHQLPPALQAHHLPGTRLDIGHLDVAFPPMMQVVLWLLRPLGALVSRRGRGVYTCVSKRMPAGTEVQHWQRELRHPDGQVQHFDSTWQATPEGHLREFVNPWLALEMAPQVISGRLHYRGVRLIIRIGPFALPWPEWLALGHTTIVETAVDACHFDMDFRLRHPLFGEVFRYAGRFRADADVHEPSFRPGA